MTQIYLYFKKFRIVIWTGACPSRSTIGSLKMIGIIAGAILDHLRPLLMFFSTF